MIIQDHSIFVTSLGCNGKASCLGGQNHSCKSCKFFMINSLDTYLVTWFSSIVGVCQKFHVVVIILSFFAFVVHLIFFWILWIWDILYGINFGRYFCTACSVKPGNIVRNPLFITLINVGGAIDPNVICWYVTKLTLYFFVHTLHVMFDWTSIVCKALSSGESSIVNWTVYIFIIGSILPLIISYLFLLILIAFFVTVTSHPLSTNCGTEMSGCTISLNSCGSFTFDVSAFDKFHFCFAIDCAKPLFVAVTCIMSYLFDASVTGPKCCKAAEWAIPVIVFSLEICSNNFMMICGICVGYSTGIQYRFSSWFCKYWC